MVGTALVMLVKLDTPNINMFMLLIIFFCFKINIFLSLYRATMETLLEEDGCGSFDEGSRGINAEEETSFYDEK